MEKIRISCICLARIVFDTDKYLLIQSRRQKNKGIISYVPIGGALEYTDEALDFLMSIDTEFETGSDLRISIPAQHFEQFREWFLSKKDRETTSFREMYEEMVQEEKFLEDLKETDLIERFSYLVETSLDWENYGEAKRTFCFFEIYEIQFTSSMHQLILTTLDSNESLKLFTPANIKHLEMISDHAKFLLKNF